MPRFLKKTSKKAGLPPGTLVHIGEKKTEKVRITVIDYDETQLEQEAVGTVEECFPFKDKPTVTWINIDGLHDVKVIEETNENAVFASDVLPRAPSAEKENKVDHSSPCVGNVFYRHSSGVR